MLFFIIAFSQNIYASNTPYSYSYIPKVVFKNQVFPVTIYAKYFNPNQKLNFEFDSLSLMQPITTKPVIIKNQNEAFFTFYFKVKKDKKIVEIPSITISSDEFAYILNQYQIRVKSLKVDEIIDFSNLISSSFRINNIKIKPYDSKYIITYLNINAKEANLEDFHIPNVIDDGIEEIKRDGANVYAKYYFIVNNNVKNISFTYYDTIKKRFIKKNLNINLYKQRVITNRANPKELTFEKLKQYIFYILIFIFVIMFIITKDKFYLFFIIILISIFLYILLNKKEICIKEGASLYILPTNNSSIFNKITKTIYTKEIKKYGDFYKIKLKNGTTGWIKNEDICKN